jgi:hypothetical protein
VTNARFAINEQRRAVPAREFDGIDTVDMEAAVLYFEETFDLPSHKWDADALVRSFQI